MLVARTTRGEAGGLTLWVPWSRCSRALAEVRRARGPSQRWRRRRQSTLFDPRVPPLRITGRAFRRIVVALYRRKKILVTLAFLFMCAPPAPHVGGDRGESVACVDWGRKMGEGKWEGEMNDGIMLRLSHPCNGEMAW